MVVNAVYTALLIGNILLIVASLLTGPRLLRLCRAGVFVNAVALISDKEAQPVKNAPMLSEQESRT
jgi:hypothetical protein